MKSITALLIIMMLGSFKVSAQVPVKEWDATFGGSITDQLISIQKTSDGGCISGGNSNSPANGDKTQSAWGGSSDYWVVKSDAYGNKQWDVRFGGYINEEFSSLIQTTDGGYLLAGSSGSHPNGDKTIQSRGADDYWIIKIDSNGLKQWERCYGGHENDSKPTVIQTTDGGFLFAGSSRSNPYAEKSDSCRGDFDYWIVKTNSNGVEQWDATFGGNHSDQLTAVIQTADGGFLLGGQSNSDPSGDKTQGKWGDCEGCPDYWVVKTDSNGIKQWDRRFGGTGADFLTSLIQTNDSCYLLAGYSDSQNDGNKTQANFGVLDYWLVKINASGAKIWDRSYGGTDREQFGQVVKAEDNGFILAGWSRSNASGTKSQDVCGEDDYWIVKVDENGEQVWDIDLGGSKIDDGNAIALADDGGYFVGGFSLSNSSCDKTEDNRDECDNCYPNGDYWIIKLSPEFSACSAPSGTFTSNIKSTSAKVNWDLVSGAQTYRVLYRKTGTIPWTKATTQNTSKKLNGLSPDTGYEWSVKSVCDPLTNFSSEWSALQNFTTMPLKSESENNPEEISVDVFPNPASSSATISFSLNMDCSVQVELFSLDGKKLMTVADGDFSAGTQQLKLNCQVIAPGIYLLKLTTHNELITRKLVIQ